MKKARDFGAVYARLHAILARHVAGLIVQADYGKEYTLVTSKPDKAGKPLYFASVRLGTPPLPRVQGERGAWIKYTSHPPA